MATFKFTSPEGKTYSVNGPDGATKEQAFEILQKQLGAPTSSGGAAKESSMLDNIKQGAVNIGAGLVRGAGSIGSTILAPIDIASDALAGKGLSLESNRQRRADIDAGLTSLVGSNPNSLLYKGGKLGGEIAGTAGVGGALANGARALGAAPSVVNALATSGMRAGTNPGVVNMLTRIGGGAVTGGAAAGLIDPEQARAGAVIGGALPPVLNAAGRLGANIGRTIAGPAIDPALQQAVGAARNAGYVIPPTQARPTLLNRALEGTAGKLTTAQNASARNQEITNRLVSQELGLPANATVNRETLTNLRRQAGQAYQQIENIGEVIPGRDYLQALDEIVAPYVRAAEGFPNAAQNPIINTINGLRTGAFDASAGIAQTRNLREAADTAFANGEAATGRSLRAASDAIEDAIERQLQTNGNTQGLQALRDARRRIAQTYTVEKALANPTSGNVDAKKLAKELAKDRPLTGGMRQAAEFAGAFPKAAQTPEAMGSLPGFSPLDVYASGGMTAATGNPLMMAGVLARPAARAAVLSAPVQNRLARPQVPNALMNALANPTSEQLLYQSAPALGSSR